MQNAKIWGDDKWFKDFMFFVILCGYGKMSSGKNNI